MVRRAVRAALVVLAVALIAMVPSAILTIVLLPLWSWVEARFQIESVGHSGPADWCYVATYATVLAVLGLAAGVARRQRR
jgi:MYXO-CTERM domain-containing protein